MKTDKFFINKKPNFQKLEKFGFIKSQKGYEYSENIMENTFSCQICVFESEAVTVKVIDTVLDEEYALVNVEDSTGSFVGKVRSECEDILTEIAESCFDPEVFKTSQAKELAKYLWNKYGSKSEHLWEKTPNNAIFRENKSSKWFAVIQSLEKNKIGLPGDETIEIINFKETPENIEKLLDNERFFQGFHMNKKYWYTVILDYSVTTEELFRLADRSYELIKK